ncbi:MAG: glycoside hydrolase family 43 protein [Clostridia bacterium]|nr:glycoside hydrolase family 43 protein [Clostridia bacterium]
MKLYHRKPQDNAPLGQADPYMIKANGNYYVYATHEKGVQLYKSSSLFGEWEFLGFCYSRECEVSYWAPSVIELDGVFYMYYSTRYVGNDDVHSHRIKVATSTSPEGPFEFKCELLEPFSIDAHVIKDDTGLYIFYCNNDYDSVRAGTFIMLDKMVDPFTVEGKPVRVVVSSLDEEIFQKDRFKVGQHWHTIEGAFYFKEGDYHYVMYSGSAYEKETYFIGYSVAKGETDDLRKLNFKKYPDDNTYKPLVCKNEYLEGSGHNSVIVDNGKYYCIYHARDIGEPVKDQDTRTFRADEMVVDNGVLSVTLTK